MLTNYVEVTLRNSLNTGDVFVYRINMTDRHSSLRWMSLLAQALNSNVELEKNFHFLGFPYSGRSLPFLCDEINKNFDMINDYMKAIPNPHFIQEYCTPETVFNGTALNRALMNKVHHHFVILQGQDWNDSGSFFLNATDDVRIAIREINNLCHEIELYVSSELQRQKNPEKVCCSQIFSFFVCPKVDLNFWDFQNFVLDNEFGNVYAHYCQTGKNHWVAFQDDDDIVFDTTIAGLRHMSGEFIVDWGTERNDSKPRFLDKKKRYESWLKSKNWAIEDKTLGHGNLLIGKVDLTGFEDCLVDGKISLLKAHTKLAKYQDTYRIQVHLNNHVAAEKTFVHKSGSVEFLKIRKEILSPFYATYCNKKKSSSRGKGAT
ncbi:MAG: hypothetical protein ACK5P7_13645 [Bdellovibrio sp.]|jgi:hypothetical protein